MTDTETKIKAFEYVVLKLRDWNEECSCKEELTRLKVMRMLFFVSGVNTEDHLFDIFDNFQAWQYGHNEGDIYEALEKTKESSPVSVYIYLELLFIGSVRTHFCRPCLRG